MTQNALALQPSNLGMHRVGAPPPRAGVNNPNEIGEGGVFFGCVCGGVSGFD
jgi:hypothetical protein